MMLTMAGRLAFLVSLPERVVRSVFALVGGGVHETAELVLPRLVRRSRLYEATAKNLLRVSIELVGGVEAPADAADEYEPNADAPRGAQDGRATPSSSARSPRSASRRSGCSPPAPTSRTGRGSYLDAFVRRAEAGGRPGRGGAAAVGRRPARRARGRLGTTARLIDIPPLELAALRRSLADLRADASGLPSPAEMAALFDGLRAEAVRERRSLLEVSTGVGIAFFNSARHVGRQHVLDPYGEDLKPLRDEGFGAYAARVARPYGVGRRAALRPRAGDA